MSWRQTAREAQRRSQFLQDQGVGPGGLVFLLMQDPREQVLWWLGCLWGGYVPGILTPPTPKLEPQRYQRALLRTLTVYAEGWLISPSTFVPEPAPQRWVNSDGLPALANSPLQAPAWRPPDRPLLFQQSSGTTGPRKGMLLGEQQVVAHLQALQQVAQIHRQDVMICWVPLYHDMGLIACLAQTLWNRAALVLTSPFTWLKNPQWWVRAVETHRGSLCWMPQFAYTLMARRLAGQDFSPRALESMRFMVNAGETVRAAHVQEFIQTFAPLGLDPRALGVMYGTAEMILTATQCCGRGPRMVQQGEVVPLEQARPSGRDRVLSSGIPLPGVEVEIRTGPASLAADHEEGVIWVKTPWQMSGYVGEGEDVCAFDERGFLDTGDYGHWCGTELFVTGRRKDVILWGGENLFPDDLEEVVAELEDVKKGRVVALGIPNLDSGTDDLVLIVEPLEEAAEGLRQRVAQQLLSSLGVAPQRIEIRPPGWLIKSSSGKISRPACREKLLAEGQGPLLAVHESLWPALLQSLSMRVLGLDCLRLEDNFFSLGGASMLAAQLALELQQALGVAVHPADIMATESLQALLDRLGQRQPTPTVALPAPPSPPQRFPLSDIQQAYWVGRGHDVPLGGVSCHVYAEFPCSPVQRERWQACWNQVIARHSMMRVVFHEDATQSILDSVPTYEVAVGSLSSLRQRMAQQVRQAEVWPLYELAFSVCEGQWRLHTSFDALAVDSWSRDLVLAEVWRLYAGQPVGEPPAYQFGQYVLGLDSLRTDSRYQEQLAEWSALLAQLPAAPRLPLAREPESLARSRFQRLSRQWSGPTWNEFVRRCRQRRFSPNMVILASYCEVLRRWSGQARMSLNLTTFQRLPFHPDINHVVGMFSSLLPLAVASPLHSPFEEKVQELMETVWEGQRRSLVSGLEVLRLWAQQLGRRGSTMLPVVFTALSRPSGAPGTGEYCQTQTPQVWLDHIVSEEDGGAVLAFDYVAELFPDGMIEAMFEAHLKLLQHLASHDEAWRESGQQGLLPAEQQERRARVNDTPLELPWQRLEQLVWRQVERQPQALAMDSPQGNLSYAQLWQAATALARQLPGGGAPIAIALPRGPQAAIACLACCLVGAAYVPLELDQPTARLAQLLESSGCQELISNSSCQERLLRPVIEVDAGAREALVAPPCRDLDELAYILFTSGSTGQAKGVALTHRAVANTLLDLNQRFGVGPQDRILGLSSLNFDLSVYDLFGALAAGATLVMVEESGKRDPVYWQQRLTEGRVTVWNSVPALMEMWLDYLELGHPAPASLRLALLSGDWISTALPARFWARCAGAQLISLGGATEAAIWSIFHPVDRVEPDWPSIPYGQPLANQRWCVLDEGMLDCPDWVTGMLHIAGLGLARGYWKDEERTQQAFPIHPQSQQRLYCTGDLGRYRPDGRLEILGRLDQQVKIRGYRVELGEIEAALRSLPGVEEALVVAPRGPQERRLRAFVRGPQPLDEMVLREGLRQRLPDYLIPQDVQQLQQFPLSANGKVDRSALEKLPTGWASSPPAPSGLPHTEQVLAWARQILEVDGLCAEDNLFQLGATSLSLVRLLNQIERHWGVRPRLDRIYDDPTPAAIAALCPRSVATEGREILDPQDKERFRLSRPGQRHDLADRSGLDLSGGDGPPRRRRSQRRFSLKLVLVEQLERLLQGLCRTPDGDGWRAHYASAGGLYPVQTYLYCKPGRVEGLQGGYYLDPCARRLVSLAPDWQLQAGAFDRLINRPIFEESAFALLLAAQLEAITPIYGAQSRHYCSLEAGLMSQILEESALHCQLGVCQVGEMDCPEAPRALGWTAGHWHLHSLLGGGLDEHSGARTPEERMLERVSQLDPEEVQEMLRKMG